MCDKTTDKERKCYAAIDIGSNAVRLLIKKEDEDENLVSRRLEKALLLRVPLRLGFDVFALGELSEKKAKKLRRLMKAFRQLMKIYEVTDYRACATSAMRDARNGKSVISRILKDSGTLVHHDIRIIDQRSLIPFSVLIVCHISFVCRYVTEPEIFPVNIFLLHCESSIPPVKTGLSFVLVTL